MIATSAFQTFITAHIMQFSLAITVVAGVMWITARRWPHFTFLVCMLALAKCLVPPVITSPAGVFTRSSSLAYSPHFTAWREEKVMQLKHLSASVTDVEACEVSAANSQAILVGEASLDEFSWQIALLSVWAMGVVFVLAVAGRQYARFREIVRNSHRAPARILQLAAEVQHQIGTRKPFQILVSADNYGPASIGFLVPKLILPATMVTTWSDRLIRPVLAHELVHARRGDFVWGNLQFAAQVIWWFHPLVWWLGRRAHVLCERCCDEEVVALTDCRAGDYAESLIGVLALKNTLRPVPLCRSISPVEITSQRLERLMRKVGKYSPAAARVNWLLIAFLALLVIPGMQWVAGHTVIAQENESTLADDDYKARIDQAFAERNWDVAIGLLRPIVENDPNNAMATFTLGYALHAAGRLDEAISFHQLAAKFDEVKQLALYNWACALALQGKQEAALAKLEESLDAGFVHKSDLTDDPDLKSLFETKKFKELRNRTKHNQSANQLAKQFDFWIGNWNVTNADGELVGTNHITSTDNGHILVEKWKGVRGGTGSSMNFFHPGDRRWKQAWVDDKGTVIEYVGEFRDGKMQFEGKLFSADGKEKQSKMTFTPNEDGSVEQVIETSEDGGQKWMTYFKGTYRRQAGSLKPQSTDARCPTLRSLVITIS